MLAALSSDGLLEKRQTVVSCAVLSGSGFGQWDLLEEQETEGGLKGEDLGGTGSPLSTLTSATFEGGAGMLFLPSSLPAAWEASLGTRKGSDQPRGVAEQEAAATEKQQSEQEGSLVTWIHLCRWEWTQLMEPVLAIPIFTQSESPTSESTTPHLQMLGRKGR